MSWSACSPSFLSIVFLLHWLPLAVHSIFNEGTNPDDCPICPACPCDDCLSTFSALQTAIRNTIGNAALTTLCLCSDTTILFEGFLEVGGANVLLTCEDQNCVLNFSEKYTMFQHETATVMLQNVILTNSTWDAAVTVSTGGDFEFDSCTFVDNAFGIYAPVDSTTASFRNCRFLQSIDTPAIDIYRSSSTTVQSTVSIDGCSFVANNDGAIRYTNDGAGDDIVIVTNSQFAGNSVGGQVSIEVKRTADPAAVVICTSASNVFVGNDSVTEPAGLCTGVTILW